MREWRKIERATLISRINNSDRNRVSVPPLVRCVRNRILGLHSHTHVPTRVYLTVISCGACAFTIAHPCTSISACAHARAHAHVYDFVSRVRTRLVRMRSSAVRSHVSLCAYARICARPSIKSQREQKRRQRRAHTRRREKSWMAKGRESGRKGWRRRRRRRKRRNGWRGCTVFLSRQHATHT